jgi:NAD(P)-dependent dehydrogenase (short-subunit alcohol dehydrogenase family)
MPISIELIGKWYRYIRVKRTAMKNLKGKHVAITGVGSGIGHALVTALAKEGCQISMNDIDGARLQSVVDECKQINPNIQTYHEAFDVSVQEDMNRWAQASISSLGQIDIVINNAGVALGMVRVEELSKENFDWVMGINFWGMVYGTQAFLSHLRSRPESAIVNISSLFGLVGIAYQAAYCTSKFAIRGYTESLRMEMIKDAPHLIVHTVHPGGVATNIANDSRPIDKNNAALDPTEANSMLTLPPAKAADIIIDHIKRKKSRVIVGSDAKSAQWVQRIWPEKYTKMIWKQLNKAKTFAEF